MKKLLKIALLLMLINTTILAQNTVSGEYGVHLFFNEKEFIDVMTLHQNEAGEIIGKMYVPNDFSGKIHNIKLAGRNLSFDLFVPRNSARPKDLIFHYEGIFFKKDYEQLIGFVTIKGDSDFVASFTGFKR